MKLIKSYVSEVSHGWDRPNSTVPLTGGYGRRNFISHFDILENQHGYFKVEVKNKQVIKFVFTFVEESTYYNAPRIALYFLCVKLYAPFSNHNDSAKINEF